MRFSRFALVVSALAFAACGGEEAPETPVVEAPAAAPAAGAATAAPITGTVHTVQMLGDAQGYRFEPQNITIKPGDGVKWVMVSGGPHNVAFNPAEIPAGAREFLAAAMPNQMTELSSPMYMNPGEEYTVSFANAPAGTYNYHCTPHLAMGMTGVVTVQP